MSRSSTVAVVGRWASGGLTDLLPMVPAAVTAHANTNENYQNDEFLHCIEAVQTNQGTAIM